MYITIILNCKNIEENGFGLNLFLLDRKMKFHLWKLEILTGNQSLPSNFSPFLPNPVSEI